MQIGFAQHDRAGALQRRDQRRILRRPEMPQRRRSSGRRIVPGIHAVLDRNRQTEQALEQLRDTSGLDKRGPLIARDNTVGHMRGRCRMRNGNIGGERVCGERERSDDHAATEERFGGVGSDERDHGELLCLSAFAEESPRTLRN